MTSWIFLMSTVKMSLRLGLSTIRQLSSNAENILVVEQRRTYCHWHSLACTTIWIWSSCSRSEKTCDRISNAISASVWTRLLTFVSCYHRRQLKPFREAQCQHRRSGKCSLCRISHAWGLRPEGADHLHTVGFDSKNSTGVVAKNEAIKFESRRRHWYWGLLKIRSYIVLEMVRESMSTVSYP